MFTKARCAYRRISKHDLGAPPENFTPELIEMWKELVSYAPREVHVRANREPAEAACRLMVKLRAGTLRAREGAMLLRFLERLRMTPAARLKALPA